jgi:hypothetical protein
MKIETKYNIGDEVWLIWEHKVQSAKIDSIWNITVNPEISVIYQLNMKWHDAPLLFKENALFPTKEELLRSL